MSSSNEGSKDYPILLEKQFFTHFFSNSTHPQDTWKPLKEKYRYYKQQSYNVCKNSSQISYLKKFTHICSYLPYVSHIRGQKIEIPLIQQTIQTIYNEFQSFFSQGGWRAVKNKSLKAYLQEYLLLKLYKSYYSLKIQGTLDSFILAFFYTLNYYKTCNYQIRLFNDFLLKTELESFFIFILLRKKSRRVNRDLSIKSQHIMNFVRVLKGERSFPSLSYSSQNEQMGQIKLLLIYPQIIEFINNNGIVLHQILIYSLLRCSDITRDCSIPLFQNPSTDWNQFFAQYFQNIEPGGDITYRQVFIKRVLKANLKMAENLSKLQESSVTFVQDKNQSKQQFLQESFEWLIGVIQGIISNKQSVDEQWKRTYLNLCKLYEQNLSLGNKLVENIFRSQKYHEIYQKHSQRPFKSVN